MLVSLDQAIAILQRGGIVAIPTETVYGLAASATNPLAIRSIYEAKERPQNHPLIVHVGAGVDLSGWARVLSPTAQQLISAAWPGPLTLIVERGPLVLDDVTGGQDSVALRMPRHPLALQLIDAIGPLVAPSANRFGRLSPTSAAHVADEFGPELAVLDGGDCAIGIESTILDVRKDPPNILRRGHFDAAALASLVNGLRPIEQSDASVRVSGALVSHYAPAAKVALLNPESLAQSLATLPQHTSMALLAPHAYREQLQDSLHQFTSIQWTSDDEADYARTVYANVRALDGLDVSLIVIVPPGTHGIGRAVIDRLERSAAPRGE